MQARSGAWAGTSVLERRAAVQGDAAIVSNRASQSLRCNESRSAPVRGGHIAGDEEDQCANL